jgi:gliding motility-associated-like protein
MMKKYNDIGDLYREKFSGYTPEPPADVWNNIQGKMNGKKPLWKKIGLPVSGAVIIIAGITAYLLLSNPQKEASATLITENNPEIIVNDNTNSNKVETSTNQIPEQTTVSNTTTLSEQQNSQPQNQNIALVQPQEESNATNDNSLVTNENQHTDIKNNTAKQTIEISRVSENPPLVITQPTVQSKAYKPVIISKDTSICENTEASLYIYNAKNIRWSTGETKNKITVDPSFSDKYTVSFTTDAGKDSMATIHVRVVECTEVHIPNAFTPNGDGLNDVFLAKSNMDLDYFEMTIYLNGGRQVLFTSKNINQGWDGTYRGQKQPHGIYFYNIRYKDNFGKIVEKPGELLLIAE